MDKSAYSIPTIEIPMTLSYSEEESLQEGEESEEESDSEDDGQRVHFGDIEEEGTQDEFSGSSQSFDQIDKQRENQQVKFDVKEFQE